MSRLQIIVLVLIGVLLFWAVGAYNRLMRLRNDILRDFVPVEQQLSARHALLQRQIDAMRPAHDEVEAALSALQAACTQAKAACAHARNHPGAAGALNSLRLAEHILLEARGRLPVIEPADADLTELDAQLMVVEGALQFARSRFNAAVSDYNLAVRQFPTWVLAGAVGFRPAGPL